MHNKEPCRLSTIYCCEGNPLRSEAYIKYCSHTSHGQQYWPQLSFCQVAVIFVQSLNIMSRQKCLEVTNVIYCYKSLFSEYNTSQCTFKYLQAQQGFHKMAPVERFNLCTTISLIADHLFFLETSKYSAETNKKSCICI